MARGTTGADSIGDVNTRNTGENAPDADPNDDRRETLTERYDRNWDEILQELRVLQTGTQILTGFLLTVAFTSRFTDLNDFQVDTYLVLVVLAAVTTALGLAPVSLHRTLFRKRAKKEIVEVGSLFLRLALLGVAFLISGVVMLIFDVVTSRTAGFVAGGSTLLVVVLAWVIVPLLSRPKRKRN